jgi:hypothetical protein
MGSARNGKFMEEVIIPPGFQRQVILGSCRRGRRPVAWIRALPVKKNASSLCGRYERILENGYRPESPDMLDREAIKVTRLEATPKSAMQ